MGKHGRENRVSEALARVQAGAERLESVTQVIAIWGGALGLVALATCGVLALLPPEGWPSFLDADRLAIYTVLSLAWASLIGWGVVQQGMVRMRQGLGSVGGGLLFVLLPLACGLLDFLAAREVVEPATWSGGPVVAPLIHWYPPALVAVTLVAYVTWKSRPREPGRLGRGLGLALVVTPYALLMASLTFGVSAPWLQGPLGDALDELGGGALAAQLALAFLVAAPG